MQRVGQSDLYKPQLEQNWLFCPCNLRCLFAVLASAEREPSSRNRKELSYTLMCCLQRSSNMSLWWTCMVMRVSNLTRSNLVRFLVVWSMSKFSISRNFWLVIIIIFLSYLAFFRAVSESVVQISCNPSNPTCQNQINIFWASLCSRDSNMTTVIPHL